MITDHGGESEVHLSTITINTTTESRIKNKNTFNQELNVFDKLISKNIRDDGLINDVHTNELKISSIKNSSPQPTPVTIANIYGGKKNRTITNESLKVLIDTGCSHSIIAERFCNNKMKTNKNTYSTGSGSLTTKYSSEVHFTLQEFSDKKIINWEFNVVDSKNLGYDMILGRDIMLQLKMDVSFAQKSVSWEGISIPMRDYNRLRQYKLSKYELNAII